MTFDNGPANTVYMHTATLHIRSEISKMIRQRGSGDVSMWKKKNNIFFFFLKREISQFEKLGKYHGNFNSHRCMSRK